MTELIWVTKIKERLKQRVEGFPGSMDIKYEDLSKIQKFIAPILDYGEKEEKRIEKEL